MKRTVIRASHLILPFMLLWSAGCAQLNDPYFDPGYRPYDQRYDDRYDYRRDRYYEERRELQRERERAEAERRRLEEERLRAERAREQYSASPPPAAQPERCPPGFTPSEIKCTPQERKRGCKDVRLPGGLGCVRR